MKLKHDNYYTLSLTGLPNSDAEVHITGYYEIEDNDEEPIIQQYIKNQSNEQTKESTQNNQVKQVVQVAKKADQLNKVAITKEVQNKAPQTKVETKLSKVETKSKKLNKKVESEDEDDEVEDVYDEEEDNEDLEEDENLSDEEDDEISKILNDAIKKKKSNTRSKLKNFKITFDRRILDRYCFMNVVRH